MNRRNVGSSRTKRRISLSKAATLATATARTSINLSTSADRTGVVLDEHPCALGESTFVAASHDQAKGLQDTADLTIDLNAHINQSTTNAQQRHPFMCREALDLNLPVPAHPHHLGKASRIVAVGFRRANGQGSMGMAGVHADHRKPGSLQGMP